MQQSRRKYNLIVFCRGPIMTNSILHSQGLLLSLFSLFKRRKLLQSTGVPKPVSLEAALVTSVCLPGDTVETHTYVQE